MKLESLCFFPIPVLTQKICIEERSEQQTETTSQFHYNFKLKNWGKLTQKQLFGIFMYKKFDLEDRQNKKIYFALTVFCLLKTPQSCPLSKVIYHYHVLLEHLPPTLVASMLTEEAAEAANKDVKVGLF